jgi:DnaJ-class molecular chaperone
MKGAAPYPPCSRGLCDTFRVGALRSYACASAAFAHPTALRRRTREEDIILRDPYEVLGVEKTASTDEIRTSYRKLAKKLHPDLNPGNKQAEEQFKEVSSAYDLLSDADKRAKFDRGEIDASGAERPQQRYYKDFASDADHVYTDASGFEDFATGDDLFAEILRRQAQARANAPGADMHYRLAVDFLEAVNGGTMRLSVPDGGTLEVKIPAGIADGQVLRLRGKGAPGRGTGKPGDALVEISVRPHRFFTREGDDIHVELPITLNEAVLGGEVPVPTPTGPVMMRVPKHSNTGATLRLKGKGVHREGGGRGDELVRLKVMLPPTPDPELESFLAGWLGGKSYDPRRDMQPELQPGLQP